MRVTLLPTFLFAACVCAAALAGLRTLLVWRPVMMPKVFLIIAGLLAFLTWISGRYPVVNVLLIILHPGANFH